MNQVISAGFLANPFSFSAVAKHQAMSSMMTQARYVDQMWDQDSVKVLKSDCILGDIVTLEQLTSHEFAGTQDKRELLAGMLSAVNAEVVFSSQILRDKVCETSGPVDSELPKMHGAEVHVLTGSDLCMGKAAMNLPEIKFRMRKEHLEQYREPA